MSNAKPMSNDERIDHYKAQTGSKNLTPAQARRVRKKGLAVPVKKGR